ncbi:hypothetical protein ADK78_25180 [Kitasatospora aureofaciens]|uniref:Uncharacterized protein n=1 Tax=Streptomyces rimosus subsp. rimosus TaxID=132474 RepID=A0ABY3YV75_STRRM|nr:hypothetical protein DF17_01315 [Streptomyces rimosus]KOG71376.1 hypothetical protein ADK78_25180 [Kitasatospora aureofaciens]KOT35691.1 hypothetical protein ADK84_21185 [Streptomyces sp. NRRL WC-3701]KOT40278.1 hypothetical protein ADK42_13635 [Streptomyces rimosus subsp. rimosus]KEF16929.1 hypothetical protein DF18_32210 [Streptomyces rimosus]
MNPGHSSSGKSCAYAGRAPFRSDGCTFAVHDDEKDGYGVQLFVHATKNGSGLDALDRPRQDAAGRSAGETRASRAAGIPPAPVFRPFRGTTRCRR